MYVKVQQKMQKEIQTCFSRKQETFLKEEMETLPRFSEARLALEAAINCPMAKKGYGIFMPPKRDNRQSRVMQQHVMARFLGAKSPMVLPYVGRLLVGNHGKQYKLHPPDKLVAAGEIDHPPPAVCDNYGHLASNLSGEGTFDMRTQNWHNPLVQVIVNLNKKWSKGCRVMRENPNVFRMVPSTVKHNAALIKMGKAKTVPTDDAQLAALDAMDSDDILDAMIGRRVSDTTSSSKRQFSKATRHNSKLRFVTSRT